MDASPSRHAIMFTKPARVLMTLAILAMYLSSTVSSKPTDVDKSPIYFVSSDAKPGHLVANLKKGQQETLKVIHLKGKRNLKPWFTIHKPDRLVVKKRLTQFSSEFLELWIQHKTENDAVHTQKVLVNVMDKNSFYGFKQQPYVGEIPENALVGTSVANLESLKEDLSTFPYYCTLVLLDAPAAFFKITGWPSNTEIVSRIDFDRERQSFASFTLQANCLTATQEAMVTVHILDENDNTPQFLTNLYQVRVTKKDVAVDAKCLIQVKAHDADSLDTITYKMDDHRLFALDESSGCIFIKNHHDFQHSKSYELILSAHDRAGHESNMAVVQIEVDAHTPNIVRAHRSKRDAESSMSSDFFAIFATRPTKTFVVRALEEGELFTVAEDYSESNSERFQFTDPAPEGLTIDFETGIVSVEAGYVWNSTTDMLSFVVNVSREADPGFQDDQPVMMYLVDREENAPIFTNLPRPMWTTIPDWIRPDRVFYTAQAIDSQPPYNTTVTYVLEAGGDGCFKIDAMTGDVTVDCRQEFILGVTYELSLSAQVVGTIQKDSTPVQVLRIRVGEMDPVFYEDYTGVMMPETLAVGDVVVPIRAQSFVGLGITYTLVEQDQVSQGVFTLQPNGNLILDVPRVYISDPHQYRMVVNITEASTGKQESADVYVTLEGENLNTPFFPGTVYPRRNFPEDTAVTDPVMSVTAVDLDQGINGYMSFTVSDSHFAVSSADGKVADITVNERLDYDRQPLHMYEFTLTATDMGTPALSGTTRVQVWLSDTADEPPVMDPIIQEVRVNQDATNPTRIHTVQAYDPDFGDTITFTFGDGSLVNGPFNLDGTNGAITLNRQMATDDPSNLTIIVTDNNALSTEGFVLILAIGVNHPPDFSFCYNVASVSVLENQPIGTSVLNVTVFEEDTGVNGELDVGFEYNAAIEDQLFDIGNILSLGGGYYQIELVTAVTFDREDPQDNVYYVSGRQSYKATILAEDNGTPQLGATCFFFVEIADENDERPRFDENPAYDVIMMDNIAPGDRVMRVFAIDDDAGDNAVVTYVITDDSACPSCLAIDGNTGWITKDTGNLGSLTAVVLEVRAEDGVNTETVTVNIAITSDPADLPPQWQVDIDDLPPVQILENVTIGYTNPELIFDTDIAGILSLMQGRTQQENNARDFIGVEQNGRTRLNIRTASFLDYERVSQYSLRLRASSLDAGQTGPFNDARLRVDLIDVNDNIPEFVGLVDETGSYPAAVSDQTLLGDVVVKVTAVDRDTTAEHNIITYSFSCIGNDTDCDAFIIDVNTGIITTALTSYDPNIQSEYFVQVRAMDNSPAPGNGNQPFERFITVRIIVTGTSINPPFFDEPFYTAALDSGAPAGTNVTIVRATDPLQGGNAIQYVLLTGNEQRRFAVDRTTGLVYTTTEILYEQQQSYNITYGVFDGFSTIETMLYISVTRRNVYPPTLLDEYDSLAFSEADQFTPVNPHSLVTVSATDPEGSTTFGYSLEGQYVVDQRFQIRQTGEVVLQAQLDRDYPGGTDNWLITVVADDQDSVPTAQRGYAILNVRPDDINDNAPIFNVSHLEGHVREDAPVDTSVLQLEATDYDTGPNAQLTFGKVMFPVTEPPPGTDLFRITSGGLIETNVPGYFDRERTERYKAVVFVADGGTPSLTTNQTIDIIIDDVNESPPDFDPPSYSFVIDEELPVGASVGAVFAVDLDFDPDPQLVFTIDPLQTYFYMDSIYQGKAGVIRMLERIDFEDAGSPDNFQFNVIVTDRGGLTDTAAVTVTVINVNDHSPVLSPASDTVDIPENTLTMPDRTFTAVDGDNPTETIYFRIDYEASDPDKKFWINPDSGQMSLLKPLDRETIDSYSLVILGIDQGTPPLTGTATLSVTVTPDDNDNRPSIINIEPAFPVVGATTNINDVVVIITIEDPDIVGSPPTMGYCTDNFCNDFSFTYENSNTGTLRAALPGYSRAALGRSFYDLDFVLGDDMGSVTETVRIYIESTNSEMHGPGESDILVYNYMGLMPDTEIGRVYCQDSDDWDLADKTFTVSGVIEPAYFVVDSAEGRITMKKGAPRGNHTLTVDVTDVVYGSTATCTTTVSIVYLFDDALVHSGSLRLSGTTAALLIERDQDPEGTLLPSVYMQLRTQLAAMYGTTADLVHLYTVRDTTDGYVDIFIVAEGAAGYFRPSKLNGLIWATKDAIFTNLGLTIVSAPINLCMDDSCFGTGCSTVRDTVPEGVAVFTNQTSLVGLGTSVSQQCTCQGTNHTAEVPVCEVNTCANGGLCEEYYNGYRCMCLNGFDGPNCEQTKLRLEGGSWAWYDHLPACDTLTVRFSFMTLLNDAVLLYNGPIFNQASTVTVDYLAIQLVGGYPQAQLDVGNGEMGLIINGQDSSGTVVMQPLSEGEWHTIEYYMTPGFLRMTVDHCSVAIVTETINTTTEDRMPCEVTMSFPLPVNNLLNVFTPLELGGRYNPAVDRPLLPGSNLMQGCMKDVWINGELVDLHVGGVGESLATVDRCPSEGCGVCPNNSVCVGSLNGGTPVCQCLPGYYGDNCIAVPVNDFTGDESFIEWGLVEEFNSTRNIKDSEVQLQFRTRQEQGTIFYTGSFSTLERSILEVVETHVQFRYDLGSGDRVLALPLVNVSDGEWHTVRVHRFGTKVILLLDDGQGKFHAETNPVNEFRTMVISGEGLTGGAYIERNPMDREIVNVYAPFPQSCIRDVRLDQAVLPVISSQPSDAAFISDFNLVDDNCESAACVGVVCPFGFCEDVWREHMCVCPEGEMDTGAGVCIPVDDCSLDPCVNGDCVMVEDPNNPEGPEVWRCNCYFGWTGTYCNVTDVVAAYTATVSTGWIIAVMCAVILLLIIVLIVVFCTKKRKAGLLDEPFHEREMFKEYNEEGAGEDDMHAYDIKPLQKPYEVPRAVEVPRAMEVERPPDIEELPRAAPEPMHQGRAPIHLAGNIRDFADLPNVGKFILGRLVDANDDPAAPPFDSVREYEYEGAGSSAGSLSSIQTSSSGGDQEFEYLKGLGVPFHRLADLYLGSDEQGSDDDSVDAAHRPRHVVVVGADGAPMDGSMHRGISSSDPYLAQGFGQDPAHQRALSMSESNVTKGILRNADSRRSFTGEEVEEGRKGILKRSSEFGELSIATGVAEGHMELAGPERIQEAYTMSQHAGAHAESGEASHSSLDRATGLAHSGYSTLPARQAAVAQTGTQSLQMGTHQQHQQQAQSQNVRVVTTTVTRHTTHSEHQDGSRTHGAVSNGVPLPLTGGDRSPPVALSSGNFHNGNFHSIDLDTAPLYGSPDEPPQHQPLMYGVQNPAFQDDPPYQNEHANHQTRVVTTQNRAWGHEGHVSSLDDYQEV